MPIPDVLDSIRTHLERWKPNSALVAIDFALRHGYLGPDDDHYVEICHLLRCGFSTDFLTQADHRLNTGS